MKKNVLRTIVFVLLAVAVSGGCMYLIPLPTFTLTYEGKSTDFNTRRDIFYILVGDYAGIHTVNYVVNNPVDGIVVDVESNDDWITVLSDFPSSNTTGSITFKVSENKSGGYRVGYISVDYEAYNCSGHISIRVSQKNY